MLRRILAYVAQRLDFSGHVHFLGKSDSPGTLTVSCVGPWKQLAYICCLGHCFQNLCLTEHLAIAHVVNRRQCVHTATPRSNTVDATCGVFRVVLCLVPEIGQLLPATRFSYSSCRVGPEGKSASISILTTDEIKHTSSTAMKDSVGGLHVPRAFFQITLKTDGGKKNSHNDPR